MHTGYDERGTIIHPTLGSWAQHHLGRSHKTLPSSVTIGTGNTNAGFFPPSLAPIPISNPDGGLQNAKSTVDESTFRTRLSLMGELDGGFREKFNVAPVKAYSEFYDETMKLLTSTDLEAFDLSKESADTQKLYGNGFGRSCMLARRLVQNGVRYVEVRMGGWDMHNDVDASMSKNGAAMDHWRRMISAQGGDSDAALPVAKEKTVVTAEASGEIIEMNALKVGVSAWRLGAGRSRQGEKVQAGAGIEIHAKPGEEIKAGQPLFTLHTDEPARFERALEALAGAVRISSTGEKVERLPLIIEKIEG
jgi:hypothetical protein